MSVSMPTALQNLAGAEQIGKFDRSELVCQIYGNLYGLPIRSIQEIGPLPELMPLPQMPNSIIGVCEFREQIIPVLHLATQLDLEGPLPKPEEWQMVGISHDGRLCALAVTDIIEIIN
ncbi:MAG: chemotaxis protein CheW [Firmicutes bacterium]|nr:chemotaxis protein CheW [Bacillota bacterium]